MLVVFGGLEGSMAIQAGNFWSTNYYNNPPLTDEMVRVAEQRLGVRLPAEYVDLLRRQNGGYTKRFAYPMARPTSWAEDHVPLEELFGINVDAELGGHNILDTGYMTEEWGLPDRQVLLAGDGHWWITLDYRRGSVPTVTWLDVECDEDFPLAPSFAEFLAELRPLADFE
ncbi:MAG: SMI1/KNR4 family protein [Armatimonadetes bacterium]|nr:SMI1/KNR4 family protein [Armatimonadota bacterium]